ncbi:MAG: [FeFe] hydrogenase H-cluster radical SAM maturase HydE [Deltaproteobacteria bacterium RBG_13_61_14]|nr:MAG: [FeFe] hydrogenase H-cluster radical SAM maturase HydE [Deltaproteobacteria bacterium RBG_13_61_14]
MNRRTILKWLKEDDETRLAELWQEADAVRQKTVGDAVHLRGLIEIGNGCDRNCAYCGIRSGNRNLTRYRMSEAEILICARQAVAYGYGTVVLQSGEDLGMSREWIAKIIRSIKAATALAVTLSLSERSEADLQAWREAGADRYLLKFETSDRALYDRIHPPVRGQRSDRFAILKKLRELGYEVGSGVMVGIPGQTYASLARDLELFQELDLDMIGVGPFLPHPAAPLGRNPKKFLAPASRQAPNSEEMTCKVVALARLLCPETNLPSTTALATLSPERGREMGLLCGANVVMPDLTPLEYRALYEIYPGKGGTGESTEAFHRRLWDQIEALGRTVGLGPGGRRRSEEVLNTKTPRHEARIS